MNKTFNYTFQQDGPISISLEYSLDEDERLDVAIEDQSAHLYMNRSAMLTFAKILVKLAEGKFERGYHLHISKDFNADLPERLVIYRTPDELQEVGV